MAGKSQTIEITLSQLDWHIINQVKKLRKRLKISQDELSVKMGFSEKLVGSIENPTLPSKYNIRHLNLIAKALGCTLYDLIPEQPLDYDLVKIKVKRSPMTTKNGKPSAKTKLEILEVKPLQGRH